MYKVIWLVKFRPDMPRDEVVRWWREKHGPLAAKTPGITNRGVKEAQYVVLTGTRMPAVLAEVSFVSSPTDESNLQSLCTPCHSRKTAREVGFAGGHR